MIPILLNVISPEQWPDRACLDEDTDVFFEDLGASAAEAKAVCAGCARLRECAQWALTAELTDGVVAAVRMPGVGRNRDAAMAELARIAATGEVFEAGEAAA